MIIAAGALVFSSQAENVSMRGDYVEVRTASVFAGACHYNGEVVTTGRDAKMANLVWYTPFVGLENRKVGYTSKALYNGKVVGQPWSRSGENSAFYGSFSL